MHQNQEQNLIKNLEPAATDKRRKIMTIYSVFDKTTNEFDEFYAVTPAKKWMRERIKLGHEVSGSKTKVYSNGDLVNCGPIMMMGSNKTFIANSRMKQANY